MRCPTAPRISTPGRRPRARRRGSSKEAEQRKERVELNLYTSDGAVDIDIEPIHSREDYLITPKESLTPGYYAFQTQDLLDSDDAEAFAQIPVELRKVYSFEYR